jgi:gamma-glutamylcyclotransferase (GGCT)/AIG2-like uncharacterized protein YtfP
MSSCPDGHDRAVELPLAAYGTLRTPAVRRRLGLAGGLVVLGPCRMPGRLVDLGAYPGLVGGPGVVHGELLAVADPAVLAALDAYEGWNPHAPAASLFRREAVTLAAPAGVRAWTYRYNRDPRGAASIPGGDWLAHERRASG